VVAAEVLGLQGLHPVVRVAPRQEYLLQLLLTPIHTRTLHQFHPKEVTIIIMELTI
jgi:hypothetical protein